MTRLDEVRAEMWTIFPTLSLGSQSIIDVVSIVNDNCDYSLMVKTIRESDGSILWVMRGETEDPYEFATRENVVDDIERAVEVLDEMDNDIEYLKEQGAFDQFPLELTAEQVARLPKMGDTL